MFTFFDGLGGMAVVAGWWGIWDIIAGLALATIWSKRRAPKGGTGMTVALVTGGNGFLGTAVIDALIAQGITVVCVDLTVKDTPDDRIRRVRADVCDPTELGGCSVSTDRTS